MSVRAARVGLPARADLQRLFLQKYGPVAEIGWSPRRRLRFGYFLPADVYEATVDSLVAEDCRWLDVGGGRDLFPDNPALAGTLVQRCEHVAAVDPSENVLRNPWAAERVRCAIEDYTSATPFDLATLRMVVEHVADPPAVLSALRRLVRPGGVVVVLTVDAHSPITWASRLVPFGLHHRLKHWLWRTEEEDTFPVRYLMNTRARLRELFEENGFEEAAFTRLDDLSALGRFRLLGWTEMLAWRMLRAVRLPYPESCLLGLYRRTAGKGTVG